MMLAVEAAVSALSFIALAILVGHLVAAGFLLPDGEPGEARKSLTVASAGSLLAFLLIAIIAVVVQGVKLGRGMPSFDVLWRYMTMTQSGNVWFCREIYAAILAMVLWKVREKTGKLNMIRTLSVLAVPLIVSRSLMSHAVAVRTDTTLAVAVDMVHLLATSLWAGGVITVWRLLVIGKKWSQPVSWSAEIVNRFSVLAFVCVALLIVSGAYQSWIQVGVPEFLASTDYGKALLLKVAIFAVMLSYGALNFLSTRRLLRVLETRDIGTNTSRKPLQRIRGEALCAILVYCATGLLTVLPPAVHAVHEKNQRQSAAGHESHHPASQAYGQKTVVGEGKVIVTVPSASQLVVEHGEIKGFMDAMTMGYRVEPSSLIEGLKSGEQVRFTIDVPNKTIVKIEKMK